MPDDIELLPWHQGGGNLAGQETGRQHLSHTALSAFLACPQKYEFSYGRRLSPIATAEPLTLGKAYQLAIEHNDPAIGAQSLREGTIVKSQAHEDKLRVYEAIVTAASTLYLSKFPALGNPGLGPSLPDSAALPKFRASFKEFEYKVRLRNPRTGYVSRTHDLLGYADEWVDKGGYAALVENKLVGQISELSLRRLPLDRQIALACYGTWRATGLEVREVFYRFVRKPSIKQRQNETVDEYCERLTEDYAARPDFYCHEEHFLRSADDLLRVEEELWEWSRQIRRVRAGDVACRNTSHCADYGGCAFIPLCLNEDGAAGLYHVREHRTSVHVGNQPVSETV